MHDMCSPAATDAEIEATPGEVTTKPTDRDSRDGFVDTAARGFAWSRVTSVMRR
jgi:hypothetical protein